MKKEFDEYMNWFKSLSTEEKKLEVFDNVKLLATLCNDLSQTVDYNSELLINLR